MNNQEIEKRFKFDLEMGVFKLYDFDKVIFSDSIFYELKMETLFKNIGYMKNMNFYLMLDQISMESERFKTCFIIDTTRKIFSIHTLGFTGKNYDKYLNHIPEYLKEYKL